MYRLCDGPFLTLGIQQIPRVRKGPFFAVYIYILIIVIISIIAID